MTKKTETDKSSQKPSTEASKKIRKTLPKSKELKNTGNLKQVGGKKYFMTPTDCC